MRPSTVAVDFWFAEKWGQIVDVRTSSELDSTIAIVTGEADADNCKELGNALLVDEITSPLQLDLSAVGFLDSSAVSELLRIHRTLAQRDISMTIVATSPAVHRVLEITGLLDIFGIAPE